MFYIVSYDIPDDSIRGKIARLCENYGLERMQFSVFAGENSRNMIETLALKAKEALEKKAGGKLIIIPVCIRCFEKIIHIGGTATIDKKTLSLLVKRRKKKVIIA